VLIYLGGGKREGAAHLAPCAAPGDKKDTELAFGKIFIRQSMAYLKNYDGVI